jgi:hypothetical protein
MLLLQLLSLAAALSLSSARQLTPTSTPPSQSDSGHIYCLSLNGTSNEVNLLAVDLLTFEVFTGPPLPGVRDLGQAGIVEDSTGTYYSDAILMEASGDFFALLGVDVHSGQVTQVLNTSAWPGAGGKRLGIQELFATGQGSLLVVGRVLGQSEQLLFSLDASSGAVALLGAVNISGEDMALDVASQKLYQVVTDGNDEDSGSLFTVSTGPGAPKVQGSPVALSSHFSFPQFDSKTGMLTGLSLITGGPYGYMRNVTLLDPATGATTDHGGLGELYVVLEDGPKAIDVASRRAFYMLASVSQREREVGSCQHSASISLTQAPLPSPPLSACTPLQGPFAEFEVTSVDLDAVPASIIEGVGLCGFIGYCPEAFAFSPL